MAQDAGATRAPRPGSKTAEPWHIDVMLEHLRLKLRNDETYLGKLVRDGKLEPRAADFKIAVMTETVKLLEMIEQAETALLRKATASDGFVPVDTIEALILDWRRDLAARAEAARPADDAPISGVTGAQKSLLVYGETRAQ